MKNLLTKENLENYINSLIKIENIELSEGENHLIQYTYSNLNDFGNIYLIKRNFERNKYKDILKNDTLKENLKKYIDIAYEIQLVKEYKEFFNFEKKTDVKIKDKLTNEEYYIRYNPVHDYFWESKALGVAFGNTGKKDIEKEEYNVFIKTLLSMLNNKKSYFYDIL